MFGCFMDSCKKSSLIILRHNNFHTLIESISVLFLAGLGGFIRVLYNKKKYSLKDFVIEIIIASFAGIITNYILTNLNVNAELKSAIIAVSGFSSREFLKTCKDLFINKLKKE